MGHADGFDEILLYLGPRISPFMSGMSYRIKSETTEIRLRVGQAVVLCGRYGYRKIPGIILKKDDMEYCFSEFCRHSVYSHENELKEGYITLDGGHRVGISGRYTGGDIPCEILSFCIRIAGGEVPHDGKIISEIKKDRRSVLIGGEPGSGKTTVLRNIVSSLGENVSLIDERGEISGGMMLDCDVFSGVPKIRGIGVATRCFSPGTVICDEISECEAKELYNAVFSGVRLIATVHISSADDIVRKPFLYGLIKGGVFEKIILLKGREHPGEAERIYSSDEIIGNNRGLFCDNKGFLLSSG